MEGTLWECDKWQCKPCHLKPLLTVTLLIYCTCPMWIEYMNMWSYGEDFKVWTTNYSQSLNLPHQTSWEMPLLRSIMWASHLHKMWTPKQSSCLTFHKLHVILANEATFSSAVVLWTGGQWSQEDKGQLMGDLSSQFSPSSLFSIPLPTFIQKRRPVLCVVMSVYACVLSCVILSI